MIRSPCATGRAASPNYDCWEENRDRSTQHVRRAGRAERRERHAPALAVMGGGRSAPPLQTCIAGRPPAVSEMDAVDASPLGAVRWAVDVHECFARTLRRIECDLRRPGGGVHRYRTTYFAAADLLRRGWRVYSRAACRKRGACRLDRGAGRARWHAAGAGLIRSPRAPRPGPRGVRLRPRRTMYLIQEKLLEVSKGGE